MLGQFSTATGVPTLRKVRCTYSELVRYTHTLYFSSLFTHILMVNPFSTIFNTFNSLQRLELLSYNISLMGVTLDLSLSISDMSKKALWSLNNITTVTMTNFKMSNMRGMDLVLNSFVKVIWIVRLTDGSFFAILIKLNVTRGILQNCSSGFKFQRYGQFKPNPDNHLQWPCIWELSQRVLLSGTSILISATTVMLFDGAKQHFSPRVQPVSKSP
jgi:hypothetical protein